MFQFRSGLNAKNKRNQEANDLVRDEENTEDTATMMNTMIVVIMVSRRVGQVTLAVSERTSCRNLNGLKAIVGSASIVPGTSRPGVKYIGIRTALARQSCAQPSF
jgi:hypothetical protein